MSLQEVFRTGVTTVEFDEVTTVKVVGCAESKALLLVRQSVEETAVVGVKIVAHGEESKSADVVLLFKSAVIVKSALEVECAVNPLVSLH